MTGTELRANLRAILIAEEQRKVDWQTLENLCLETLGRLNTEAAPDYPYDTVYHFLDDPDVRQKDEQYARVQRERLKAWLELPA
jgi:hypothetical protein